MRIPSLLLAASAALTLPAEAAPQPAAVPPAPVTTPTPTAVTADVAAAAAAAAQAPLVTPPPVPWQQHEYHELLKRSWPALPKGGANGRACPVDCDNGFCCPAGRVCHTFTPRNHEHLSVVCAHPYVPPAAQ